MATRTLSRTIDGITYDVIYQKIGTHTYKEVLIPRIEIEIKEEEK